MIYISPTQMHPDPRYAFAVGKIRVMETRLLNTHQVARLLETKTEDALLSELANNQDYEQHVGQLSSADEYEILLAAEQKRVYKLITDLDPDKKLLHLLALRHDFHNCKVISKALFLGETPDLALSNLGLYPVKEWEQLFAEDGQCESEKIPPDLMEHICATQLSLEAETDLRLRDIIWDQALYECLFQQISSIKNVFVQKWIQIRIDSLNLLALIRCKQQNAHKRILERTLLNNGLLAKERLLAAYEGTIDELPIRLAFSPYAEMVQEGVQYYQREKSFSHWEKLVDDFEIEFLQQARLLAIGVEPLFAYLLAKENELKVLRIIMVGKLNQLDKTEISKRVRKLYA